MRPTGWSPRATQERNPSVGLLGEVRVGREGVGVDPGRGVVEALRLEDPHEREPLVVVQRLILPPTDRRQVRQNQGLGLEAEYLEYPDVAVVRLGRTPIKCGDGPGERFSRLPLLTLTVLGHRPDEAWGGPHHHGRLPIHNGHRAGHTALAVLGQALGEEIESVDPCRGRSPGADGHLGEVRRLPQLVLRARE
jgi:hypothetical protein